MSVVPNIGRGAGPGICFTDFNFGLSDLSLSLFVPDLYSIFASLITCNYNSAVKIFSSPSALPNIKVKKFSICIIPCCINLRTVKVHTKTAFCIVSADCSMLSRSKVRTT